jgi:hypothetical protein
MKRYKRLYLMLGVLCAVCIVTFAVSKYEEHKELIQNSDEIILELPSDSVQSLSWEYDGQTLAFHRGDTWLYDDDEAFPVDEEKIGEMLEQFQEFGVSFIIEDVEDYGQYGLDDPVCTIDLGTEDQTYEVLLGDFSVMDSQRYVSIGDGNVYLVQDDPLDYFDAQLSDVIKNDEIPDFDRAEAIRFSGEEEYQISYQEDSGDSYREEDVYFTQRDGRNQPLDPSLVEGYLDDMKSLGLTDYVTYNASETDLATYGLDDPELTVSVDYTLENEDGEEESGTVSLSISRDPEEIKEAQEKEAAQAEEAAEENGEAAETDETAETDGEETEEITAYARVGDSPIIYQITSSQYLSLMKASYDDLRHPEVLPASFEDISQVDISLEGADYTITSEKDGDERVYYYQDEELEIDDFKSALEALSATSFTDKEPEQKEEISLTVHLDLEDREEQPTVRIQLYRYDGTYCLAVVDGEPVSLVKRSSVVDLMESVNAIVLN